jgi:hypothetical protein
VQAAQDGTPPGDDDDEPEPEVATMDYVQRRIRRLTAQRRASERALQAERQQTSEQLAALRAQNELMVRMLQGAAPDLPPPPDGPPQAEQFQSSDDYVRAAARYEAQQVRDSDRQQTQAQQAQQALLEREAAFAREHADYQEVVRTQLAGKVAPHLQQALMLLPDGPALAYALAQQPETVQRLNQLPPPLVFLELGRLGAPTSPPAGQGTDAATRGHGDTATGGSLPASPRPGVAASPPLPPPLSGVNGQGTTPPPGYREGMPQEDYRRYRQQTSTLPVWKQR